MRPQPLIVEYELVDRLRELVALPPALESPCAIASRSAIERCAGFDGDVINGADVMRETGIQFRAAAR